MPVLLTGAAGFVGYHVAEALLARGDQVVGVDNLNGYYDVRLKQARLDRLAGRPGFTFARLDIADEGALAELGRTTPGIDRIVHLAAQAGVRHSLVDPHSYVRSNVVGHLAVLELARSLPGLRHLVYASSSSVYGANSELPFRETDRVDRPLSIYAATKRADELMSYSYGHLFAIPQTGLRFFTVYGPWGRPDMAYFMFARAILRGEPITVYDDGSLRRDFTYVDDIVAGVVGCLDRPPAPESGPPVRVLNIGNHRSEAVSTLIDLLERELGRDAVRHYVARPRADVQETWAAVDEIADLTGFSPNTPLHVGVAAFSAWYRNWHSCHG
jgi:UDP-glucuronate 4-epimerase